MAEPWTLSGEYFEACNCEVACPCVFGSDPTRGNCTVLVGWHVRKGRAGNTALDGLSFALAAATPGNMLKTKWTVAVFVDERASPSQRKVLEPILGGQAGGPLAGFGPLIGKMLGITYARMEFHAEGKRRSLRIHGIGEMASQALEGAGGAEVRLAGAPLLLVPEVTVAKAEKLTLKHHEWNWATTGGNSFYSPFEYKGP